MKKFILGLAAVAATFGAQAITVTEAFDKISALQGAAVSEMPDYDIAKEGLDWGKMVMLIGSPADAMDAIAAEITDEKVQELEIQGHKSVIYAAPAAEEGKSLALVITKTPMGPVAMFVQGSGDVVATVTK